MYPYIITGNSVVVVINNKQHTLSKGNIGFDALVEAIKEGRWEEVPKLVSPVEVIRKFSDGLVDVVDGQVTVDGEPVDSSLSRRIGDMFEQGFDIQPLVNFMHNLYKNPSKRAVDELYGFLEAGNMPITEDGYFLAYKKVRDDYKDVYSGTFDNSVGQVVSMPRNKVDDNKENTCSVGLHFCSFDYLKNFGGSRIMILKINPADVAAIPIDYQQQKGRTCRYTVIGEVPQEELHQNVLVKTVVDTRWDKPTPENKSVKSGSVESRFDDLTDEEFEDLCEYLGVERDYDLDVWDFVDMFTFRDIRTALDVVQR